MRLEEEVARLTTRLATKEAELTETQDLLAIARRIAGEHYTEASLAKHRFEQLQNNFWRDHGEPDCSPYESCCTQ